MRVLGSVAALMVVQAQWNKDDNSDWSNWDKSGSGGKDMDWSNWDKSGSGGKDMDWSNWDKSGSGDKTNMGDKSGMGDKTNMGDKTGMGGKSGMGDKTGMGGDKTGMGGKGGMGDKSGMGGDKGGMGGMDMNNLPCTTECANEAATCMTEGKKGMAVINCVVQAAFTSGGKTDCATCLAAADKGGMGGKGGMGDKTMGGKGDMGDKTGMGGDKTDKSGMGGDKSGMGDKKGDWSEWKDKKDGKGDGMMAPTYDDCANEFLTCKDLQDEQDEFYRCLITASAEADNRKCAGVLTMGEEGDDEDEGDFRIGMACLEDMNLCALLDLTAEQIFSECLIPAVEAETASDACMKAFMRSMGPMMKMQMHAEEMCSTEAGTCLTQLGIASIDDIDETNEWDMMNCVADASTSDECSNAIEKLMLGTQCAEDIDEDAEDADQQIHKCMAMELKDDSCHAAYAETGECDMEMCKMNEKSGHCYMKHGDKDKDGMCADVCASYMESCMSESMEKKAMMQCVVQEAGMDSDCGKCMKKMADKMDGDGKDGDKKVMVKATFMAFDSAGKCDKEKDAVRSRDMVLSMGCNNKEGSSQSLMVACPNKDGTIMMKSFASDNCSGEPMYMARANPKTTCMEMEKEGVMEYHMASVEKIPEMCRDKFVDNFSGEFLDFSLYCEKQKGEYGCNQCSGKFDKNAMECRPPTKANKVKCRNIMNMELCAAIGCKTGSICRGNPKFN